MALPIFNPSVAPSPGTTITPTISLNETSFGDGYTQSSPKGLNHIRRSISLKWEGLTVAQVKEIETFLVGQGGYKPFYFTHFSDGAQRKWTCKEWTISFGAPPKVTATFQEDFSLQV